VQTPTNARLERADTDERRGPMRIEPPPIVEPRAVSGFTRRAHVHVDDRMPMCDGVSKLRKHLQIYGTGSPIFPERASMMLAEKRLHHFTSSADVLHGKENDTGAGAGSRKAAAAVAAHGSEPVSAGASKGRVQRKAPQQAGRKVESVNQQRPQ
jgi:hypothetical protein